MYWFDLSITKLTDTALIVWFHVAVMCNVLAVARLISWQIASMHLTLFSTDETLMWDTFATIHVLTIDWPVSLPRAWWAERSNSDDQNQIGYRLAGQSISTTTVWYQYPVEGYSPQHLELCPLIAREEKSQCLAMRKINIFISSCLACNPSNQKLTVYI